MFLTKEEMSEIINKGRRGVDREYSLGNHYIIFNRDIDGWRSIAVWGQETHNPICIAILSQVKREDCQYFNPIINESKR